MAIGLRVLVVLDHHRVTVHGVTTDPDEAARWGRELIEKYDDPLAFSQTVAVVHDHIADTADPPNSTSCGQR